MNQKPLNSRRAFLRRALGSSIAAALPSAALRAADAPMCPPDTAAPHGVPQSGGALPEIGEIRRGSDGVLRATLAVEDANRSVWIAQPNTVSQPGFRTPVCRERQRMRFYAGGPTGGKRVWPAAPGVPGPGPTLRARVGDHVQITLLNHVDVKNFPDSLDLAERGKSTGCDISATLLGAEGDARRQEVYPLEDKAPNCFHGSSSANLHFHGFHVSPSGVADNVLVQVRPSPRDPKTNQPLVTEAAVRRAFEEVFAASRAGHAPRRWEDLPKSYRDLQEQLLKTYDKEIPAAHLGHSNAKAIQAGLWPPYACGAYPNTFRISEQGKPAGAGEPPLRMGQAPGTHWYHSHKHGSTALNSFNGMAGAFIVEGDYDDKLRAFYGGRLEEKVLVIQQYAATLNLLNAPPPNNVRPVTTFDPLTFINGAPQPVIAMRPGQVQHWRMLNASGQQTVLFLGIEPAEGAPAPERRFEWRQTAQDGIQFSWNNYRRDGNRNGAVTFAPANRADLLVKAPAAPGRYHVRVSFQPFPGTRRVTTLMSVDVSGPAVEPAMGFPSSPDQFPALPAFLANLDPKEVRIRREVTFHTESFGNDGRPGAALGRGGYPRIAASRHTIDGAQFENNVINHVMLQESVEEWTLFNTTQIPLAPGPDGKPVLDAEGRVRPLGAFAHPFHIHINPFQVVEMFDPVTMEKPVRFDGDLIWQDTIGVPPAYHYFPDQKTPRTGADGKQTYVPGYVKIRTRFADFSGLYVFHCHILAHEDRGMMDLVQVVPNRTLLEHAH